jgi:predicted metal-dependent hydrolase
MCACDEPPPRALLEAIAQFNRGEYFDQHETLEGLWRAEPREVRRLYQGILQIGLAFHHLRRGNHHGAVTMLARGARHLAAFTQRCQGVDVDRLLREADAAREAIEGLGPARIGEFDWRLVPNVRVAAAEA